MNAVLNLIPDSGADTLTALTHFSSSCVMAKTWKADGTIAGYDTAKRFRVEQFPVRSIAQFGELMKSLVDRRYTCLIRGQLRTEHLASEVVLRDSAHFKPAALHLFAVDVDKYEPAIASLDNPKACIEEYILSELPECFHNASYVYHLSASFGHPSAAGVLKCHLFFWLKEPQFGSVLRQWIKANELQIDRSMCKDVQPIYTSNPVFEDGVVDPFEGRRGGLVRKSTDEVDLVIDAELVESALEGMREEFSIADPCEKPGLIGLFCRTFTMDEVLERWLADVFERPDGGRRMNYLLGGGSKGGAWVTDDEQYVGNSHDSDPCGGRLSNKWDLVRQHVFGKLDAGLDEFGKMSVSGLPSQLAMMEMVAQLPEIKAGQRAPLEVWRSKVVECANGDELLMSLCPTIAADSELGSVERGMLEVDVKARYRELTGQRISVAVVRQALTPPRRARAPQRGAGPDWAQGIYYLRACDKFYQYENGSSWTAQGFNAEFNRFLGPDRETTAASMVQDFGWVRVVENRMYVPYLGDTFALDGRDYVNGYVPTTVPVSQDMGPQAWECVEAFRSHLLRFCRGREWVRDTLIQWMAHNVQKPGEKILWSPLLKGCQGDGKTLLRLILQSAMGGAHVGEVSSTVLHTDFNGFAHGKAVVMMEEIRASGKSRFDVLDKLKPLITNTRIAVHRKGENEVDVINTTNYLAATNHSDALPVDQSDRRWMVVFSPYMSLAELAEDVGDILTYFEPMHRLYREFEPHVRYWLLNVPLDGFEPQGAAPHTDEREELIENSRAELDDVVAELIEGLEVVNSRWLSRAIEQHEDRVQCSKKLLPKVLERLGYRTWHRQFKLKGKNVTIYGKAKKAESREWILDQLSRAGHDEEPNPF